MSYDGSLKFDTKIDESGFNSGISKLGTIAKGGLSVLAGAVTGITAAMGTGMAAAVNVGMNFESQMSKVQAISGATGEDLTALTEKAKEMGAKTKFSATESGQALEYMAMAGWKTGDMLSGIEGIMNLAAASGEDLAATSDIVTDALTAFGLSAKDSTHFADVLAVASSNANTNVAMMGETFKYVAPVAGALGFSAEDTATAIGLMANAGIKGSQAGTNLRAIMSRLAKPTDDVQTAMDKLGISLTDSQGNMKSFSTIMGDLRKGFAGLSEAEAASMAATIGGQEAMSGLLAIVTASDADFAKLESAIYSCDGAAAQMAETMNGNLKGQLTILKSSAEALGLELYDSVKEPLTGLAKLGIEELNKLTQAFKDGGTDGLIKAGGEVVTNLLLGVANGLPNVIDMALLIIQSLVDSVNTNLPQLMSAGGQILMELAKGVVAVLPSLGNLGYNIITTLLTAITQNAPQMLTSGTDVIVKLMDGISKKLPELVPMAASAVLSFVSGLVSNFPKIAKAGLDMLIALAEGVVNSLPILIAEVPKIINEFCSNIDSLLPQILSAGVKVLQTLGRGIVNSIPTIKANAEEIVKAILNVITHLNLFSTGKNIVSGLGNGLKSMFSSITSIAKNLINFIKNPFNINWGSIGSNIVSGIANGIKAGASAIANAAKNAAKSALNAAKNFLGIHSPSTVFRDQVGKYMATGMGVGFENNIPIDDMQKSIDRSVKRINNSIGTVDKRIAPDVPKFVGIGNKSTDYEAETREIIIHNHIDLDGKEVGNSVTRYVDSNFSDNEELRKRGN